jgi:haloalkane dehalogenase
LHYLDEGTDTEGPPLLAVHGNPTWSFYYRRLVRRFQNRHRVVAVDHVGCGLSDKPQHYPYTLAQHRDNLLRLIEHLDLREITLVVHDWGGAIGLSAAVEQPERFARLVLLNTAAFPPPYLPRRIAVCRWPVLGPLAVRGGNAFARAAVTMAMADHALDPLAKAGLLAPYGNWHDRVAIQRFVEDIPMTPRHPTYAVLEDLERRLPTLADRPIQLIWGMQDWCFRPECHRRLQAIWPQASTLELPQAGHYVLEDAPDAVLDAIERIC